MTIGRALAAIAIVLAVTGCAELGSRGSDPPKPSGGLTSDQAVALARTHVAMTDVLGATAGTYGTVNPQANDEAGIAKPDRWVWAVRFGGDITICNPLGVCLSPRPATSTVFLDYFTGAFVETSTVSPNQ